MLWVIGRPYLGEWRLRSQKWGNGRVIRARLWTATGKDRTISLTISESYMSVGWRSRQWKGISRMPMCFLLYLPTWYTHTRILSMMSVLNLLMTQWGQTEYILVRCAGSLFQYMKSPRESNHSQICCGYVDVILLWSFMMSAWWRCIRAPTGVNDQDERQNGIAWWMLMFQSQHGWDIIGIAWRTIEAD